MYAQLIQEFLAREDLPASYGQDATDYLLPLAEELAQAAVAGKPLLVGVNGAQGTGKSTLCQLLADLLGAHQLTVANLSLDDFYLTRAARLTLAAERHPLLRSRGVPGTHDTGLLQETLAALGAAGPDARIALPRFDKAADDRLPREDWPLLQGPVHLILLEGWFVGAQPQTSVALAQPVNRLEAEEDRDGCWRRWVNERLATEYQDIFAGLDRLIMLAAPSFEQVYEWRALQEEKLRRKRGDAGAGLMTEAALRRFIEHFERLTRHCLATLPERADVLLQLDVDHRLLPR